MLTEAEKKKLTYVKLSSKTFVYLDDKGREVLRVHQGWSAVFIRRRMYNQFGLRREELLKEVDTASPSRVELLRVRTFFPNERVEKSFSRGIMTKKIYVKTFDSMGRRIRETKAGTKAAYGWGWRKVYEVTPDRVVTEYNFRGQIVWESYPNGREIFLADLKQYRRLVLRDGKTGERIERFFASVDLQNEEKAMNCLEKIYRQNGKLKSIYAYQTQHGRMQRVLFFGEYDELGRAVKAVKSHHLNLTTQNNLLGREREE